MSEKPTYEALEKRVHELEQAEFERMNAEAALRESNQQIATILESISDAFFSMNDDMTVTYFNRAAERLLNKPSGEVLGRNLFDAFSEARGSIFEERYRQAILQKRPMSFETFFDVEPYREWYDVRIYPQENGISVYFQVTTARKQTEEQLRFQSEIMTNMAEAVYLVREADGIIVYTNSIFEKMFGYEPAEMLGKHVSIVNAPTEKNPEETARDILNDIREKGYWKGEVKNIRKDGTPFWCYAGVSVFDHSKYGKVLVAIHTDINEYKQAQQELEKLAEAVNQASEGIVVTSVEGRIIYANPAFEQISGYANDEIIGQTPRILKSNEQDSLFYKDLWETILSGKRWAGRIINKRKDASLYTAECSITPVKNQDGHIVNFIWLSKDITREIDLEKRAVQAQKMEALGSLAGGIAHDFNNILSPIIGLSEILLEDIASEHPWYHSIEQINNAGKRAGGLVKQILSFSRKSNPRKLPIKVQPILKEVISLARATIPSNIEIKSHISSECGMVSADPTQVHQIAMNLITNAYHAVEETGGTIKIGLKETGYKREDFPYASMESGKYARISISDTGIGIDKSLIGKIFEPYFTTKEQGKGTGLGLSVVHGIVKEYGGDVRVYSEVGEGTTFDVYLPLLENPSTVEVHETAVHNEKGTERILLVDDEEPIARLIGMMLQKLGYRITTQTSSLEALETFKANPDAFDLVITDMSMPNMTGRELAKELISIKPGIPIIICTGFSEKMDKQKAAALGIKGFLLKPVSKSDLARMIRKVLDEGRPAVSIDSGEARKSGWAKSLRLIRGSRGNDSTER